MHHTLKRVSALLLAGIGFALNCPSSAAQFEPLPGAGEASSNVRAAVSRAWEARGSNYEVRSHHVREDGTPLFANRLILELSPYLNQHAHNPVNWYPWGKEAFAEAEERDRPMLISIGYSSCHWCHVMEDESYDDISIATMLNRNFVSVKVDRESHPDVDELYLLALEIMGMPGGWPLHVFATSEGKPFLGMTYLPPGDFMDVLAEVSAVWESDRSQLAQLASLITQEVQAFGLRGRADIELGKPQIDQVIAQIAQQEAMIDEFTPPSARFPQESELFLLLDAAVRYQNDTALRLAADRLTAMAMGGIRDHVGGGFHRYSIDNEWLVPHFEKMLYNQAHLARAYLHAYELTGKDLYRRVAEQTLDYVLRDMTSDEGLFWSATDADSEGAEGRFFLWTADEMAQVLGDDAEFAISHYGVTDSGNFYGANILHLTGLPEDLADSAGLGVEEYLDRLAAAVEQLRISRDSREKPFLDDKVITAWNAAMITTLAKSWPILKDREYLDAAVRAAEQLWTHTWDESHALLYRIRRNGTLGEAGKLRDYAYLAQAMLSVYDEIGKKEWLTRSETLVNAMLARFWDSDQGGFFTVSSDDADTLIARQKDRFDEALPSGNSVAANALSMLSRRTGQQRYARFADQLLMAYAREIARFPISFSYTLKAMDEFRGGPIGISDYAASGNAQVAVDLAERSDNGLRAVVELNLAAGWHIQSNQPLTGNLFATQVASASEDWILERAEYPAADEKTLSFQEQPVSVWSGKVRIPVVLKTAGQPDAPVRLEVQLQACSDVLCLLPESVQLEIPSGRLTD